MLCSCTLIDSGFACRTWWDFDKDPSAFGRHCPWKMTRFIMFTCICGCRCDQVLLLLWPSAALTNCWLARRIKINPTWLGKGLNRCRPFACSLAAETSENRVKTCKHNISEQMLSVGLKDTPPPAGKTACGAQPSRLSHENVLIFMSMFNFSAAPLCCLYAALNEWM